MKKIIEDIGKKVIEFIYDFDNNGYEFECDKASLSAIFSCFGHDIVINMNCRANTDVEVFFPDYDNLSEAVWDYVENEIDLEDFSSSAESHHSRYSTRDDEWQQNGFCNSVDYWHWRGV